PYLRGRTRRSCGARCLLSRPHGRRSSSPRYGCCPNGISWTCKRCRRPCTSTDDGRSPSLSSPSPSQRGSGPYGRSPRWGARRKRCRRYGWDAPTWNDGTSSNGGIASSSYGGDAASVKKPSIGLLFAT
ncbi:hypothetical protein CSUI_004589, partial [Cystoisospora suis]